MSELHILPTEVIPSEEELAVYGNLRNIRFRKDAKLITGLFMNPENSTPVVTISSPDSTEPYMFSVEPEKANPAFEHPYGYAPKAGRLILQDILSAA